MHNHAPSDPNKPTNDPQLNQLWNNLSHELRGTLGESAYDIWFSDFRLGSVTPEEIVMIAPGTMYAIWVEENFKTSLTSAFTKFLGSCGRIRFEVNEAAAAFLNAESNASESEAANEAPARVVPRVLVEKVSEQKLLERGRAAGLVEIFRFENFVPGENSELAWAAARAETDDDREWLPAPGQKSGVMAGMEVTDERIDAWLAALTEAEAVLNGSKLAGHWRFQKGFSLPRVLAEMQSFDLVLWVTGHAALPFLADGPIADGEAFANADRVFSGDLLTYAFWFN